MQPSLFDQSLENSKENNPVIARQNNEVNHEEEIRQLLKNLSSARVNTLRDKVAWILNQHSETRDSDISLLLKYWETFDSDIYNGEYIDPVDLFRLTRLTSISRERARIQNVYKLFLASTEVRHKRGTLSEEEKDKSIKDKPKGYPSLVVYMDESGKNEDQMIVGSLWFLESGKPIYDIHKKITYFREEKGFDKEFHFSEMSLKDLPIYQEMVTLFLHEAPTISFKLISLPTSGIQDKQDAINQLFYHLIIRGIENENSTGRAILPRILQVWKDSDEEGSDRLIIADLEDRLKQASLARFNNNLYIDFICRTESSQNVFIQIADLFSASANRVINQSNLSRNHKTEFAEFFLNSIGVNINSLSSDQIGDKVIHFAL